MNTRLLSFCSEELESKLMTLGTLVDFSKGDRIIRPGDEVSHFFILLKGSVRLYRNAQSGERHIMYNINGSCACAMSMISALLGEQSSVDAIVESDARTLLIPQETGRELISSNEEWRDLIFKSVFDAWQDSLHTLDQLAFDSLQNRLLAYLEEYVKQSPNSVVNKSHAEIASDLNVSREAVSRGLKKMEKSDKIHLGHGSIKVLNLNY
jgi:CRP/FNR family transcriptional regulator